MGQHTILLFLEKEGDEEAQKYKVFDSFEEAIQGMFT
jgi:hypothetical protein